MADFFPEFAAVNYAVTGHSTVKGFADVFYPGTPVPFGGYPALLYFNCVAFQSSQRDGIASENDGHDLLRYYALTQGIVLIDIEVPITAVGGAPVGGGMWRDPLVDAEFNLNGGGDDTWNQYNKWAVQFFRANASFYGINPNKFGAAGNSAGSFIAMDVAMGPDYRDQTNAIPMRRVSSRVQALVDLKVGGWLKGTVQDSAVGGLDTVNTFLRKASDPAALATDGEDAIVNHVLRASPNWILAQPGARELNRRLPYYTWTHDIPEGSSGKEAIEPPTLTFDLDADLVPTYTGTATGGYVDRHGPFGGLMRIKALRALDSWHDTHSIIVATGTYTAGGITPAVIISDQHEAAAHQAVWLAAALAAQETVAVAGPHVAGNWFTVTSLGAKFPTTGEGGTTDDATASHLAGARTVLVKGIYVDAVAGSSPSVTITDAAGLDVQTYSIPAVSTGGRATEFLNVQRGVLDYGAAADSTTAALSPAVVVANTVAYLNNIRRANAGRTTPDTVALVNDDVGETCAVGSTTTVAFARYAGGEDVDHRLAWEALEYIGAGAGDPNQIAIRSVQEVTIADTSATTTTAAVSAISVVADTFVMVTSQRNNRNADGPDSINVTAVLNVDKTITVTRGATSGEWKGIIAVIEGLGSNWQVETWSHTFTSPGGTAQAATLSNPIPAWGNAFIVGSMRCATGHLDGDESGMIVLPGADLLTVGLAIPAGADDIAAGTYVANGWVVYNADITVQHNNNAAGFGGTLSAFGGTVQTNDNAITTVDLATSFILVSGISTGSAANLPSPNCNVRLKTDSSIETWRGRSASGSTVTYAIQVVSTEAPGLDFAATSLGTKIDLGGMLFNGPIGARVSDTGVQAKVIYEVVK